MSLGLADTQLTTVVTHNFMRAGAAAWAGQALGHAGGALQERRFEGLELLAEALAPARGHCSKAAAGFEAGPDVMKLHSYMSYMVT